LEKFSGTPVLRASSLCGAGPCGDGLADIVEEVLPGGAAPLQGIGGDHLSKARIAIKGLGRLNGIETVTPRFTIIDACGTVQVSILPSLEVKLLWRDLFNQLPNDTNLAIRQREELRRTSVLRTASFSGAGPSGDGLTNISREILPGGAIPLQSVRRDHFQAPGLHIALGILHVHMKVGVRILPIDARKRAREIQALTSVELDGESMVRKRGNCRDQSKEYDHKRRKLNSHRDVRSVKGFGNNFRFEPTYMMCNKVR
jgi:hypothetical protein